MTPTVTPTVTPTAPRLRVLDLTDELGAAAIRTLVGLGADVVRCPAPDQPRLPRAAWLHWYAGVQVVAAEERGSAALDRWVAQADVVVESGPVAALRGVLVDADGGPASRWPAAVHVVVTPFGLTGLRRDWQTDDLVAASAGGMTWLGGRVDGPPKAPPREQALQLAGAHAAIAAHLGLLAADRDRPGLGDGAGQLVDVAVHEAVAATLETGAIGWIHAGTVPRRTGGVYQHVAHRVFRAADGYAAGGYSGSNRMWTDLLAWLQEVGEAEDLGDAEWADPVRRWAGRAHVDEVVARFAARRTAAELASGGRGRALPWAAVTRTEDLADNPQLQDRGFFLRVTGAGAEELVDVGPAVGTPGGWTSRTVAAPRAAADVWTGPRRPAVPPRRSAGSPGEPPLAGLRVLDLTWVLAGPYATRLLAEHGADVVKVESMHRQDPTRFAPSMRLRPGAGHDDSGYFLNVNRGKRSIAVNTRTAAGADLLRALAAHADVVIDNYSPGTTAKWGLDHPTLSVVNPRVITVSMAGVGRTGPWRDAVTFADTLAAMSGLTAETADPGGDPQGLTFGLGDMVAANAAVIGLLDMLADGRSGALDLSQLEAMAASMGPALLEHQLGAPATGATAEHPARRADRAPHGVYPVRGDDRWIAVSVVDDARWRRLVDVVVGDRPEEADRLPAAAGLAGRKAAEDAIDAALSRWAADRDGVELVGRLQAAGIAAALVATGEDLVEHDEQLAARGFYPELTHPIAGLVRHEGLVARAGRTPARLGRAAPLLGEHTDEVLAELATTTPVDRAALDAAGALT